MFCKFIRTVQIEQNFFSLELPLNLMTRVVICLGFLLQGSLVLAAAKAGGSPKPIATITKFFGKVIILSSPAISEQADQTQAIFEGSSYVVQAAKLGAKVYEGSVVQTKEKSMARLVFENGDQVMVAAQSSYKISTVKKPGGEEKPVSDLLYGKFRAIISSEGPRKDMEVRTRTMVMGIRGTDFHVSASDASGSSTVSVLRGVVAVAPRPTAADVNVEPVSVAAGFSAKIPEPLATGPEATPVRVAINKTDKVDLQQIKASVSFKQASDEASPATAVDPETQKRLAQLEEQAISTTKSDIKSSDPELYKRIEAAESKGRKIQDLEVLQEVTLAKALISAPEANPEKKQQFDKMSGLQKPTPPPPKPSKEQLKEMEDDVYDKYFKK